MILAATVALMLLGLCGLVSLLGNRNFLLLVAYFTLPAIAGWVVRDWMPSTNRVVTPGAGPGACSSLRSVPN